MESHHVHSLGCPAHDYRLHHERSRSVQRRGPWHFDCKHCLIDVWSVSQHCNSPSHFKHPDIHRRPVYSGAAYFILARTLYYIPWLSPLHPGRVLTTFIGIDLLIEILIGNGAAKAVDTSNSAAEHQVGEILVKTALILQACTFAAYLTILFIWHRRAKSANLLTSNLRKVVWTMYASATFISVRCIYRIVEYFQGWDGEV
jgi:NADH:ubiquinone oxidoreductase subunit K